MAGAGFKSWVDGDILTAADVNTYLMQQAVMRFADSAARTSAIAAPSEGMVTYLVDTDAIEYYDGAAWQPILDQDVIEAKGDLIVGIADDAVSRLAVGTNEHRLVADSGESTGLKYVADTTNYAIAAKGDLLAGTAADTVAALSVGTNGYVLTADSAETTGMKWAVASSGGKVKQVVSTFKNDGFSTTSSTNVDVTGLSLSITPTSASNKVLVLISYYLDASTGIALVDLVRDSTIIGLGSGGSTFNSSTGGAGGQGGSYHFLDSPATTSATTYKVQMRNTGSGTVYIGKNSVDSWRTGISITALEIEP